MMPRRAVEERLGRHAADVGAAPADPHAIHNRDGRTTFPGLERGRFARGAGANDHEIEHQVDCVVATVTAACRRCRHASYRRIAAAAETFSESAMPSMGRRMDSMS